MLHPPCNFPILSIVVALYIELATAQVYPRFSPGSQTIVHSQVGMTVRLYCLVHNLGPQTITWIRQSDLEILSAGLHKITSDPRINVLHESSLFVYRRTDAYTLEISRITESDAGFYECQINMIPMQSRIIQLQVNDIPVKQSVSIKLKNTKGDSFTNIHEQAQGPSTEILGSPDIYFSSGTLVNLTCVVTTSLPPGRIFWYHEGDVISYYSSREGVSIQEYRQNSTTVSSLLMKQGTEQDAGHYICRPEKQSLQSAEARLFIFEGTQTGARRSCGKTGNTVLVNLIILNILIQLYLI